MLEVSRWRSRRPPPATNSFSRAEVSRETDVPIVSTRASRAAMSVGAAPPDMAALLARVDTIGTSVSRLTSALEKEFVAGGGLRDLHRLTSSMAHTSDQLSTVIANQDRNVTV